MGEDGRCTNSGSSPYLFVVHVLNMLLNFETVLTDGKMSNIIILQHQKPFAFLQKFKSSNWSPLFVLNLKNSLIRG